MENPEGTFSENHTVNEESYHDGEENLAGTPIQPIFITSHLFYICKLSGKVFVGGLSWQTTADGLRFYFEKFW